MNSVFTDCKVTVLNARVADDAIVTFSHVDMRGYEGVAFIAGCVEGAVYTGYHLKAQQDTTTGWGTVADLEGSDISFSSLTGVMNALLDIKGPTERYVRPILTVPNVSATSVVCCTAIQYGGRTLPATQDATTTDCWTGELKVQPAEGTA